MKVYLILGVDSEGHAVCEGAFQSKAEAHRYFYGNNLHKTLSKGVIAPVTVKEPSDETSETTGQMQHIGKSVAKAV